MEHRLLLCVSPGRTRAFILGLLSADRNDCNQTFQGEETENVAHRLIVTDFAGYENEGLAVDSIPLMYRNGLNSLFFARRLPTGTIQRVELYRDRVATTRSANQHRPRWTFASLAGPDYPWRFEPLANSCLNPGSRSSMKPLNLVVATPTKAPFKAFQVPTL